MQPPPHPKPSMYGGSTDPSGKLDSVDEHRDHRNQVAVLWDGQVSAVIMKPAGLATQTPNDLPCLEQIVRQEFSTRSQYIAFPHRLDRPVSGLILVAFQKRAARLLSSQFESRKIQKRYVAWVEGEIQNETVEWTDHLVKLPNQAKASVARSQDPGAKLAQTRMKLVHYDAKLDCSLLELHPITGRMHQLRVQAASRGHCILGDSLYGNCSRLSDGRAELLRVLRETDSPEARNPSSKIPANQLTEDQQPKTSYGSPSSDWIALRAESLAFFDPRNAQAVTVTAEKRWAELIP